ncbi:hypothetical protein RclHR1_02850007 [Rhizophagus clarus]|uniref:AIG1-type G domain-containing protein n=1 Tax=Rhizophagus clarus TaxID=94130 RepID=A0A2Z6RXP5_9GLOM|nr:hypothetical protein RclHR1_02850007 [Rhizophagus clarus]
MSKEQERFNTQYSNEKEINIGSKGIFDFFKSEFAKSEGSLKIKGFKNLEIISLKELKLTSLKISNCSQLNKVHLFELTKLTSLSLTKCPKLTTDNCSLIKLTSLNSLKINNCSEFKKIFDLTALPKLKKLSIVGCSALITFDYSSTGLIDLEISDCSQINHITGFSKLPNLTTLSVRNCQKLTKLDCSFIKTLTDINLCLEIKTLNCSNNHKLTNLDASNCSKLEFLDCTNNKLTILDLRYCSESIDVKYSPSLIIARKKKILIVGRTGGGKSTLANVLTNSNEFKESAYAINETKYFRKKEFEWNEDDKTKDNKEDNFRVVDTIGVGDTKLSTENTLFKIADGILLMPEGISHVLFVINGRFTKEEIDTFNLIKESLFKSDILRYVTIYLQSSKSPNVRCLPDLQKKTLPKLKTLSIVGCSALTTFDYSPTGLIDLEISDCSQLNQITGFSKLSNLKTLSVRNCPKLIELDCSSIKTLTELEVSDLIELNCSNTSIDELSLNLCPNIKNLNCSNNHKLTNLDASNCSKLEFLDCTNSKLTFLDLSYCPESIDVKHSPSLIIARKKKDIKNILVVGRTGGGKSTLANVLTNSNEFKESAYAISETKYFRKKEFEWNEDNKEDNFRVVDTIGVGDTKLSTENTLFKIADGILSMPEGISHVLFVINGRFTKEEIDTFNLIKESLFKSDILRYVTIVRSNFSNFRTNKECDKDIELMRNESDIIAQIVNSCNGVVHVDNPSVDLFKDDDEDDDEYEQRIDINRNARKKSRKIVLNYLEKNRDKPFRLDNWDELCKKIVDYIRKNNLDELEIDPDILRLSEAFCLIL